MAVYTKPATVTYSATIGIPIDCAEMELRALKDASWELSKLVSSPILNVRAKDAARMAELLVARAILDLDAIVRKQGGGE